MVISLVVLAFIAVLALAGATGFGVADSRDVRFNLLGRPRDEGRAGYDHLLSPQGRAHVRAGVRR